MLHKMIFYLFLLFLLFSTTTGTADSDWRGFNRDGIYTEDNLLQVWPDNGLDLLWSVEKIGKGYASAAVTEDYVLTTGMINNQGYVFAYDHQGTLKWKKQYGPEHYGDRPGTRTTPTVVEDRLYLVSGQGRAVCLDINNGNEIWAVDLVEDFGAKIPQWGIAESPLIDGDHFICTPGGSKTTVVALNRHNGDTVWTSPPIGENSAYCSPKLIEHNDIRMIVTMTAKSIIGIHATTGELLWRHSHITDYDIHPNTPIYYNDQLYCVSGYGTGGVMLKLSSDGKHVSEVWRDEQLDSQMGAAVLVDGYIYGSGHDNRGWKCLDWNTGEVQYSSRDLGGKGNIIFADGRLYCYSENGQVGLVRPNTQNFDVISSFKITRGTDEHWAHLVIHDGKLYVRHGDTMMVFTINK